MDLMKDDDFVPTAEFVPVFPLPALVKTKLGDENENLVFEHRARIYRFDSEVKQWKERGTGNIKILQDKDKPSQARILMRRESVLKLACNHGITGNMKVEHFQSNPKILKWAAVDHCENSASPEIFTCRFAAEEKCAEFKAKMEEMIELVASSPSVSSSVKEKDSVVNDLQKNTESTEEACKPLSELFKKEVSECEELVAAEKKEEDKTAKSQVSAFSFGIETLTVPAAAPTAWSVTSILRAVCCNFWHKRK